MPRVPFESGKNAGRVPKVQTAFGNCRKSLGCSNLRAHDTNFGCYGRLNNRNLGRKERRQVLPRINTIYLFFPYWLCCVNRLLAVLEISAGQIYHAETFTRMRASFLSSPGSRKDGSVQKETGTHAFEKFMALKLAVDAETRS